MTRAFILRSALLWLAIHAFVFAATGSEGLTFSTLMSVLLIVLAGVVGIIDTRRRGEYGFLGNLGLPRVIPSVLWAGTVFILEIGVRALTFVSRS